MSEFLIWTEQYGVNGWVDVEFFEDMQRETGKTPAALFNRPSIRIELAPYVSAFFTLSRRRRDGIISLTEIAAYLTINPAFDPVLFVEIIDAMDSVFLRHR